MKIYDFFIPCIDIADLALLSSRFSIAISTNSLDMESVPTPRTKVAFLCSTWSPSSTYRSM